MTSDEIKQKYIDELGSDFGEMLYNVEDEWAYVLDGYQELIHQVMLSSAERPKQHYRGNPIIRETVEEREVRRENAVRLLSVLYAYQILQIGRCLHRTRGGPQCGESPGPIRSLSGSISEDP